MDNFILFSVLGCLPSSAFFYVLQPDETFISYLEPTAWRGMSSTVCSLNTFIIWLTEWAGITILPDGGVVDPKVHVHAPIAFKSVGHLHHRR